MHRVVELCRSHASLSTVVVSRRGSIGPAMRHRAVAPRRSSRSFRCCATIAESPLLSPASLLPRRRPGGPRRCSSSSPQPRHLVAAAAGRPRLRLNRRRDRSLWRTSVSLEPPSAPPPRRQRTAVSCR
ncbi:hypothetical protein Scep_019791 [Stephania cephalantha]|uniref:Uncharacterized protein n=1 Tax=Stephania cephalantha TaxID=152367 RepID=A0AAP0IBN8_9MAGN